MSRKIAVLSGDGIGPEVVSSTVSAIIALTNDVEIVNADIGYDCFKRTGEALPKETVEIVDECDAVLMGCVTVPDNERNYRNPALDVKRRLDLFANVRPISRIVPDLGIIDLDAVFVRENTEGLFEMTEIEDLDGVTYSKRITYAGCKRICQFSKRLAGELGRKHITCLHKANVYKQTDGLFLKTFYEVMNGSGLKYDDMKADDMASYMVMNPSEVDMIVTQSLYGDIVSEEASALVGGTYLSPSCGIGDRKALFEPMHRSNPELAGLNVVNPTASLMSGSLLLMYLGYTKESMILADAVRTAYKRGYRTADVGGKMGTYEFTDCIVKLCNSRT